MKIGFFDSGLGGLLVLKAVARHLPQYDYEYFGDTANLPYGDKTEEEIFSLTKAGVEQLFAGDCALVIVACNTASAESLRRLQIEYEEQGEVNKKVLGVIIPTIEEVLKIEEDNILLIGTKRTVESGKYEKEFAKIGTNKKLTTMATPELVPLIESGKHEEAKTIIRKIISERDHDCLILGCTHYSLVKEVAREGGVVVLSQDEIIPAKLEDYLSRHSEIEQKLSRNATRNIVLTKHTAEYDSILKELLGGVILEEKG